MNYLYNKSYYFLIFLPLIALFYFIFWFLEHKIIGGDAQNYLESARNILNHGIFSDDQIEIPEPSFYRPPFYSFYISILFKLFGNNIYIIQISQIILHIISSMMIAKIALQLNLKSYLLIFFLAIVCPFNLFYTTVVLSETLSSFFFIIIFYLLIVVKGKFKFFLVGLFAGFLALTRDIYILLIFFILFHYLIFFKENHYSKLVSIILLCLAFLVVITPWTIRNYLISEKFVLISEGRLGYSLWTGTWATNPKQIYLDKKTGLQIFPPAAFKSEEEKKKVEIAFKDGIKKNDLFFKELAFKRILEEPHTVLKKYFLRAPSLWLGTRLDIFILNKKYFPYKSKQWYIAKLFFYALNSMILIFSIFGIICLVKDKKIKKVSYMLIPLIYTIAIYLPLNSFENRYSQPVYFFLIFFAGDFLYKLYKKIFS